MEEMGETGLRSPASQGEDTEVCTELGAEKDLSKNAAGTNCPSVQKRDC